MGLFNFFKKKSTEKAEAEKPEPYEFLKWDKMWNMWEDGKIESPYGDLMTYQSEVNNGGHSQFFFNVDNTGDVDKVVEAVLSLLSDTLSRNLETAFSAYKKYNDSDDDKMEEILDECDSVFYENDMQINIILEKYSETIEL